MPKIKSWDGITVIGVDAGSQLSGIAIVHSGIIIIGQNVNNENVINEILKYRKPEKTIVVIEDVRPYSLQLSSQIIETCKFIGELKYRLKTEISVEYVLRPRSEVKQWVFDNHAEVCLPRIEKKIAAIHARKEKIGEKGLKNANGEMRKPSFAFVDDRIIITAMKEYWNIPTAKVGKPTIYGLKDHSWQALALITMYMETTEAGLHL